MQELMVRNSKYYQMKHDETIPDDQLQEAAWKVDMAKFALSERLIILDAYVQLLELITHATYENVRENVKEEMRKLWADSEFMAETTSDILDYFPRYKESLEELKLRGEDVTRKVTLYYQYIDEYNKYKRSLKSNSAWKSGAAVSSTLTKLKDGATIHDYIEMREKEKASLKQEQEKMGG